MFFHIIPTEDIIVFGGVETTNQDIEILHLEKIHLTVLGKVSLNQFTWLSLWNTLDILPKWFTIVSQLVV
jgi:hypothetical protein